MPRARVGKIELYYLIDGSAGSPWVVLIPGFSAPLEMWAPQLPALVGTHRVLTYDLRGHGRSDSPFGGYDVATQSRDLLGLMEHIGIDAACIVGDAAGGAIAVELALAHPERVSQLVLVGTRIHGWDPPAGQLPPETAEEQAYNEESRRLRRQGSIAQQLQHWWLGDWSRPLREDPVRRRALLFSDLILSWPAGAWRATMASPPVPPHFPLLPELQVPTLVIHGGADMAVIQAHARQWCATLPNATQIIVPGAGHVPNWEFPELFNRALLEFLRESSTHQP